MPTPDLPRLQAAYTVILNALGTELPDLVLQRTPERAARALCDLAAGYRTDPAQIVQRIDQDLDDGAQRSCSGDGLVAVRSLGFVSLCRDHLLPFSGCASIAYQARRAADSLTLLEVGSLAELVRVLGRRLQLPELLALDLVRVLAQVQGVAGVLVRVRVEQVCLGHIGAGYRGAIVSEEASGTLRDIGVAGRAQKLLD